jgi:hypothetical protein
MNQSGNGPARLVLEVPDGREFDIHPALGELPPGTLSENSRAFFHLRGDGFDPFKVGLMIDGIPLEAAPKSPTHVRWSWDLGFHAGMVTLKLTGCPQGPVIRELITDPDVGKLTREDYHSMVGDILQDTLALVSLTGHRMGIAKGKSRLELARFEYLRSCFQQIEAAVLEINRTPWSRLQRVPQNVPAALSGGASRREVYRAIVLAGNLRRVDPTKLSAAGGRLAASLASHLPLLIPRTKGQSDTRLREHSDILGVLSLWRSYLIHVRTVLSGLIRQDDENPYVELMLRQATGMIRKLESLAQLPLFEGLVPSRGGIQPSHLYLRVPPYMAFYKAYRAFLAGLANISGDFLNLPLRQTFDLYELWCFLRLARAAATVKGTRASWKAAFSELAVHGGLVMAIKGVPLAVGDLCLVFQPNYAEIWKTGGPAVGSFSRPMQPDMAIVGPSVGELPEVPIVVIDAKYRVETQLNDAITAIHTYRDALVREQGVDEPRRTVKAAFVITPHAPYTPVRPWPEEQVPDVFFREGYREAFRFGAITMRPGIGLDRAQEILTKILSISSKG